MTRRLAIALFGFQSGAAYQRSPTMMSFLPSLLMSATPTPSARNFGSRTVFFQTTANAGEAKRAFIDGCLRKPGA